MTVQFYWKDRLEHRCPLFRTLHLRDLNYVRPNRKNTDSWPSAVLASEFYADYCDWFVRKHLIKSDSPFSKATADSSKAFRKDFEKLFSPLRPTPYKRFACDIQIFRDGKWVHCRRKQKFYKLSDWRIHKEWFEDLTGTKLILPE